MLRFIVSGSSFFSGRRLNCFTKLRSDLNKFKYQGFPVDNKEDTDFTKMIARLKNAELKQGYNLLVWRTYINTAAYREIRDILIKKGRMWRK